MQYQILKPEDFVTGVWSGGTTTQLAIYPQGTSYADRDFVFRLSSATVDTESSEFTYLPDYDRWLMILEGSARLVHDGRREITLNEYEYDAFDGGIATVSYGKVRDYNLMLQKGSRGSMEAVSLDEHMKDIQLLPQDKSDSGFAGIFLTGEYAALDLNGETVMLKDGCQLLVIFEGTESVRLSASGNGTAIVTQGIFNI